MKMTHYISQLASKGSSKNNPSAIKPIEIRLTLDAANGWQPMKSSPGPVCSL